MPSRNIVKKYVADGIYHVYNRGVDKRDIFCDESDYKFFLFLLKLYLSEESTPRSDLGVQLEGRLLERAKAAKFFERIDLLAFALMPNHYHFLIRQKDDHDLTEFVRAVMTTYVAYFNKKYERRGPLFQGVFKAILIDNDDYLLHLSRYIHLNPRQGSTPRSELGVEYSSYQDYLGLRETKWLNQKIDFGLF